MIIRKLFKVENSHIVRNCTSNRCSHSVHGHSAVIEIFLECNKLDNAGMVYDFGLLKSTIKDFIDSSDHCHFICMFDKKDYVNFFKDNNDRWITLPFNPSAEMLTLFYFHYINLILQNTIKVNGEGDIKLKAIRYHETSTGYAECDYTDYCILWNRNYDKFIQFSEEIVKEWSNDLLTILNGEKIINPKIEQQITWPKL